MNIKEILSQFSDIQKEIKELKIKIDKLEPKSKCIVSDSVKGTSPFFPYIETNYKIQGLDVKAIKNLNKLNETLEKRYNSLLELQVKIELFINELPTSRLRRIFIYRYIEDFSWVKIASLIDNKSTSDSIRKEHDRYLEKNKVCPFCPEKM